jgi:hypothetical protein
MQLVELFVATAIDAFILKYPSLSALGKCALDANLLGGKIGQNAITDRNASLWELNQFTNETSENMLSRKFCTMRYATSCARDGHLHLSVIGRVGSQRSSVLCSLCVLKFGRNSPSWLEGKGQSQTALAASLAKVSASFMEQPFKSFLPAGLAHINVQLIPFGTTSDQTGKHYDRQSTSEPSCRDRASGKG